MTLRLQIILLAFLATGMIIVVNMVRKRVLELKYVLTWMFADITLVILVLFPGLIGTITHFLGIYSPMNMIFFLGFVLSLCILFTLTAALSRVTADARRLSQTVAILERELEEVKRSAGSDSEKERTQPHE